MYLNTYCFKLQANILLAYHVGWYCNSLSALQDGKTYSFLRKIQYVRRLENSVFCSH